MSLLFGKKSYLYNTMPRITRQEMWKRANATFRSPDNPQRQDFAVELVHGAHQEVMWLEPGEMSEPIDPTEAKSLYNDLKDQGIVLIEDEKNTGQDIRMAGLERAAEFYNQRGDQAMLPFEFLTEQQRRTMSRDLQGIRINQAREKVVREYIEELLTAPVKPTEKRAQVA